MFIWTFLITKTQEISSCSYALKSWNTLYKNAVKRPTVTLKWPQHAHYQKRYCAWDFEFLWLCSILSTLKMGSVGSSESGVTYHETMFMVNVLREEKWQKYILPRGNCTEHLPSGSTIHVEKCCSQKNVTGNTPSDITSNHFYDHQNILTLSRNINCR